MNIVVIAGIRAQFMKTAAFQMAVKKWNLSNELRINPIYINTGQHYDAELASVFLKELEINFDIDLTGQYSNNAPISIMGEMLVKLDQCLRNLPNRPDWVIVFGDANTTLVGSLVAVRNNIRLAHVEAGLRTGNISSPEEQNRIVADHVANALFLSSHQDKDNLTREGLVNNVFWAGDLICDLVLELKARLSQRFMNYSPNQYILATIHRQENLESDEILESIFNYFRDLSRPVVFVAHPRTRNRLIALGLDHVYGVVYLDGLNYIEMLTAIKNAQFVFTDSGALQRESYYLGKRCLIRQDIPFWSSLTQAGVHNIVGQDLKSLRKGSDWMEVALLKPFPQVDDFGSGLAGETILKELSRIT
jgi:UDP-GlcNAc3NAcA epimerase